MDQVILNKIHSVQIEILDTFVRICEENKLAYFLTAGTLIGAIRHNGFIPWDDDVDVAMPRSDYEKFLDILEEKPESNYYALSERLPPNTKYHYYPFAKLCKKDTLFADKDVDAKDQSGIWIDIWPFDNTALFFLPLQTCLISFLLIVYHVKMAGHVPRKKTTRFLAKLFSFILPEKFLKRIISRLFLLFNKDKTEYVTFLSGRYGHRKETHKYKTIFPLQKHIFEGKYYDVPADYDIFLKTLYGNYMELPSPEKRRTHSPDRVLFEGANPEVERITHND